VKANDRDAIMRIYAADAVVWLPQTPEARGEKAIRSPYEGLLSANTVKDVVLSETRYIPQMVTTVGWSRCADCGKGGAAWAQVETCSRSIPSRPLQNAIRGSL